MHRKLKRLPFK